MNDLERFFRRLVANLAATDPSRLHRPLALDEIHRDIVPYRANRRALALESSEDYELVLLRLCAGEGHLVRTEPEEARARFGAEVRSPNPDLSILHRFEQVLVTLEPVPLARALGPAPSADLPYAPPAPPSLDLPLLDLPAFEPGLGDGPGEEHLGGRPIPSPLDADELLDADALADADLPDEALASDSAPLCLYCGGGLPVDRAVRFCPHCGQRQSPSTCPACQSEVEPGWRHCVSCGSALGDR